ncbi:MAG: VOC family protein, partial [Polyangiaceae bacterium]|nr:VOC family protein [Polyangiaceae bacterium]
CERQSPSTARLDHGRDLVKCQALRKHGATGGAVARVTLAQNVGSKAEVDAALRDAVEAGATLLKPAADTFWAGYSGYFADPDGHPWEVACNPFWRLDGDGRVVMPG